jgi:aquaglyceroporin related protein
VAQVLLSTGEKTAPGADGFGSYQSITWACAYLIPLPDYQANKRTTDGASASCSEST